MQSRFLTCSLLLLTPISCVILAPEAGMLSGLSQAAAPVSEPYVQVSSVSIEPAAIHKTESSNTATVTVQVFVLGQVPPNPKAVIEVGTYSSDPPNNELKYENPIRAAGLDASAWAASDLGR